jgi:hypothetical protein
MPFYQGTDDDVVAYYENSHYFQACVTQALPRLMAIDAPHYVFIADDLVLNPAINETNVIEQLGGRDRVSLPFAHDLSLENGRAWERRLDIATIKANSHGCEWETLLPDRTSVIEKIHGLGMSHLVDVTYFRQILKNLGQSVPDTGDIVLDPVYPCLATYSDIFVMPREMLPLFAHYAGITAAMKLFVEVAIPTVAILVGDKLDSIFIAQRTRLDGTNYQEFHGNGVCLWQDAVEEYGRFCDYKVDNAFTGPFENAKFVHPIKLSKWV